MKRTVHKVLPDDTIELERRIEASPDTVFAYFTDAEKYMQWQGVEAELDPRPGGIFRVVQNEVGYVARGSGESKKFNVTVQDKSGKAEVKK